MNVDLTNNFRELVKQYRENPTVLHRWNISQRKTKSPSEFRKKALVALSVIIELEKALDEESNQYDDSKFLPSSSPGGSVRRDQFEIDFQNALKSCAEIVGTLKKIMSDSKTMVNGRNETIAILEERIKQLNRKYNEQQNLFFRRRSELEKLSKLCPRSDHRNSMETSTLSDISIKRSFEVMGDGDQGCGKTKNVDRNIFPDTSKRSSFEVTPRDGLRYKELNKVDNDKKEPNKIDTNISPGTNDTRDTEAISASFCYEELDRVASDKTESKEVDTNVYPGCQVVDSNDPRNKKLESDRYEPNIGINPLGLSSKKNDVGDDALNHRKLGRIADDDLVTPVSNYEVSNEEAQLFEQENRQLYHDMISLEDLQSIETKVEKIAELQVIFAENVLTQDADIQRIADKVVGTTDNIKQGNEEIVKALKNAGSRIVVMVALFVLGLSVLCLHWYND